MRQQLLATTGFHVQEVKTVTTVLADNRPKKQAVSIRRPNNLPKQLTFEKQKCARSIGKDRLSRFVGINRGDAFGCVIRDSVKT
jgi:hypothetical protein